MTTTTKFSLESVFDGFGFATCNKTNNENMEGRRARFLDWLWG
jgi:hypothetical protein